MLEAPDFLEYINEQRTGALFVGFLESWKRVADQVGIEAVDIAENAFASLCRFATRNSDVQARLSTTVFAAYWSAIGEEEEALAVLNRWLPMTISSRSGSIPIEGSWRVLERRGGESARDLVRRAELELDARVQRLPAEERHTPLFNGWESLTSR